MVCANFFTTMLQHNRFNLFSSMLAKVIFKLLVFGLSRFEQVTPTPMHQLQNKVQAVLPRPRHPLRSQPGVSDGNSSVSRRQQITFRATLIFHLIDGLFLTTPAHEVRRAGVLTCGSCHLERSARLHPLILSSSENCLNHSILVKLSTFEDFRVFLCALASG